MTTRSILLVATLLASLSSAQAQQSTQRIRGDVIALQDSRLQIKTPTGDTLSVKLADTARITVESRVDLSAVVPGVFVGTTSAPQTDGSLRAVQIRIFPEALRGTGEGHRLMDPQGRNTMTNATVTALNTMTNATVTTLAGAGSARSMTLKFKDGEKQVFVPEDVPVILAEMGDRSLLIPGAHIVANIIQQTDGSATTERITVGKNGSQPM
jgi:hypothetical protein